jgi:hypothetical protein
MENQIKLMKKPREQLYIQNNKKTSKNCLTIKKWLISMVEM